MTETQVERLQALNLRRRVAQLVAEQLRRHLFVKSIIVFGSVATGSVDEHSDVDILIICHPELIPLVERTRLLSQLGAGWQFNLPLGNPLFAVGDEGGVIEGVAVSVHYQQVAWIDAVLSEVLEQGAITSELLPFRPYTLPALLQRGWLLIDKEEHVARWRMRTIPYPPRLKQNIVQHFIPILQEQTDELLLTARRGIGPRAFLFHLNRAVDALISILYAFNENYDPADRRAEQSVWPFLEHVPVDFIARITAILTGPFDQAGMERRAEQFQALAQEVMNQAGTSA